MSTVVQVRLIALLLFGGFLFSAFPLSAQSPSADLQLAVPADRVKMNENTVHIVTGHSHSAHLQLIEDMASVLDDGFSLRVIPMVGKGAVQNVVDVLNLKNTDMGVTQADILSYLKRTKAFGDRIDKKLLYVTKLFNEELHLVASSGVADIQALNGQKVNVGLQGSGSQLTSSLVFSALGIDIVPQYMEQAAALAAIRDGSIAASLIVSGKPTPIFDILRVEDGLKFLEIPFEPELEDVYLPTTLSHEDYPSLIPEGQSVDTLAVPAVLTVFNWGAGTDRYRRVTKLIRSFFSKFAEFRKSPRHPKWREVNLYAPLKGWSRFGPAQQWLDQNLENLSRQDAQQLSKVDRDTPGLQEQLTEFARSRGIATGDGDSAAQERLFSEFLEWRRQNQSGTAAPAGSAPADAGTGTDTGTPGSGGAPRLW